MTRHGPALLALSALAIAGWTYNVNYDTRAALDRIAELRGRIAEARESLQVLRVEWAYLNNPDRLARLVARYDDRLALVAMTPEAFGYVAAVPYPPGLPPDQAVEPPQTLPPELLLAVAQQASAPAPRGGATAAHGQDGLLVADAGATATATIEPAASTPAGAGDPGLSDRAGVVLAAAADKAEALAAAPAAPTTMREAVTLALIEAGIVMPGAAPAPAALIPASMGPGVPVPPVRPAVLAGR